MPTNAPEYVVFKVTVSTHAGVEASTETYCKASELDEYGEPPTRVVTDAVWEIIESGLSVKEVRRTQNP
jgi:hypothetical protein